MRSRKPTPVCGRPCVPPMSSRRAAHERVESGRGTTAVGPAALISQWGRHDSPTSGRGRSEPSAASRPPPASAGSRGNSLHLKEVCSTRICRRKALHSGGRELVRRVSRSRSGRGVVPQGRAKPSTLPASVDSLWSLGRSLRKVLRPDGRAGAMPGIQGGAGRDCPGHSRTGGRAGPATSLAQAQGAHGRAPARRQYASRSRLQPSFTCARAELSEVVGGGTA